jgi:hypothetical protein
MSPLRAVSFILILSLSKDEDVGAISQTSSFDKLRMRYRGISRLREESGRRS